MREKATIAEVAEAANVAASTVSRVLNGGYASARVRAKVEKVIQRLGYTPSPTARNLKMGRTGIIGVVAATSQGAWFTQLLGGIEQQLIEKRVSVALGSLVQGGRYDATAVKAWISERRIDGIIFARAGKRERPLARLAEQARLPMVFVGPDETFKQGVTIGAANREAGRAVGQYLLGLGHERIAFAGGPRDSIDSRDRLDGLKAALELCHLDLDPDNISFGADYTPQSGVAYATAWLALPRAQAPTAVVLGNDSMALGFLRTIQAAGVKVPEDVSVVGFDGIPEGGLCWPGLTSAAQPTRSMGSAACQAILRQIHDASGPVAPEHRFALELVIRESAGPAPARRRARAGKRRTQS